MVAIRDGAWQGAALRLSTSYKLRARGGWHRTQWQGTQGTRWWSHSVLSPRRCNRTIAICSFAIWPVNPHLRHRSVSLNSSGNPLWSSPRPCSLFELSSPVDSGESWFLVLSLRVRQSLSSISTSGVRRRVDDGRVRGSGSVGERGKPPRVKGSGGDRVACGDP